MIPICKEKNTCSEMLLSVIHVWELFRSLDCKKQDYFRKFNSDSLSLMRKRETSVDANKILFRGCPAEIEKSIPGDFKKEEGRIRNKKIYFTKLKSHKKKSKII